MTKGERAKEKRNRKKFPLTRALTADQRIRFKKKPKKLSKYHGG